MIGLSTKKYFLATEAKIAQTFESVSQKAFSVINGLGCLIGHLAGAAEFFFEYNYKRMEHCQRHLFRELRPAIQSGYSTDQPEKNLQQ
jgi:hypothetical protein